jgi:SAM-dependent methyltransferase
MTTPTTTLVRPPAPVAAPLSVGDDGVRLPVARGTGRAAPVGEVVTVAFDGRYVWSFRPARDARPSPHGPVVPWPASLRPHLRGRTRVTLADPDGSATWFDAETVFGDRPDRRLRLEDAHGHPLAVNKVGNLTRVFGETGAAVRTEILRGTARVLTDLREHGGVEAFLSYGCLLGAVREGRMIGTDCDADVCYVSDRTHPAEVVLESYALERAMLARGWTTVRMSGGDFKVLLRLEDGRTCYVDVFVGFWCDGVYYQLGNRSGRLDREALVPTSTIVLEGVELPAPADPEAVLAFVYGPSWRTPDPAFRFTDPPAGVRRLDGWLRGYRDGLPAWNEVLRGSVGARVPRRRSDFARWVRRRVRPGDTVVEIGSGTGRDAAFFARHGHPVVAYDASPEARTRTQRRLRRRSASRAAAPEAAVRRLVLGELRTTLLVGAEVAALPGRRHLYARHVVGALDEDARRDLWRLARMALAGTDGRLFLELATPVPPGLPAPTEPTDPTGLVARLDPDLVVAELASYGGVVDRRVEGPGTGLLDQPDPSTCRLQVGFPRPGGPAHV